MSASTVHPPDGYSLHDAASVLGVSLNTLRKRIANGQVKAERIRRPQGHVWRVYLASEHPATDRSDQDADLHAAEGSTVQYPVAPGTMQAEAMAAYTRSILAPMVEALERSEGRSRELERDAATLAERLAHVEQDRDAARAELDASEDRYAALLARTEAQSVEPTTDAVPSRWRAWGAGALMVLTIAALVVLLGWPR